MKMRTRNHKVIGIAVAAGLLAAAVAVVLVRIKLPEWRITRGLINLGTELAQYYNPVLAEAELDELWQKLQEGATHTVAEVAVSLPEQQVGTLDLKLDKSTDRANRRLKAVGEIGMFGKEGPELEVAMEGEQLYLTLPDISSKAIKLDADSLVSGFNDSFLAKLAGWSIPEDYLKFIFGDFLQVTEAAGTETTDTVRSMVAGALAAGSLGEAENGVKTVAAVRDFLKQVEINPSDRQISIENSDWDADWEGYTLKLPGEAVNQLFSMLGQVLGSEETVVLEEQLLLDIYMDQKNRIVRIATSEPLVDPESGRKIAFTLDLLGEERTVDTVTMVLYVTDETKAGEPREAEMILRWNGTPEADGSSMSLSLEWKPVREGASWPERGSMTVVCQWDYAGKGFVITGEQQKGDSKLACEMQGNLLDVVPGESAQVNVEKLKVRKGEKEICSVTGTLMLEPLKEKIEMPKETISMRW